MLYIVMGVSGRGKSTVAQGLSKRMGCNFEDADDYHPPANKNKMSQGIPLTDEDREPWLIELNQKVVARYVTEEEMGVLACSALKAEYRTKIIGEYSPQVQIIYLRGDYKTIFERLQNRKGHFFDPKLLQSQFATLEKPQEGEAWTFDITASPESLIEQIYKKISES